MSADEGAGEPSIVIALHSPLSPRQAQAVYGRVEKLLAGSCQRVICDLSGRADLRTVDVLARLALLTQRRNIRLELRASVSGTQNLEELLALTGLECLDRHRNAGSEPRRQAEPGE